jgi:hypothetical protein
LQEFPFERVSPLLRARAGRIGGMAFSFLYLAVRALFGAVVRSRRGLQATVATLGVRGLIHEYYEAAA